MKGLIITICLLVFGVMSCSACAKQNQVTDQISPVPTITPPIPSPTPSPTSLRAVYDNLEVTLPGTDWNVVAWEGPAKVFVSDAYKLAVILERAPDTGFTYQQYILTVIRSVRDAGGTFFSSKQVELNGHKFVLIESTKNDVLVYMWVTLEQGVGYTLTCGGPSTFSPKTNCSSIFNTTKIN